MGTSGYTWPDHDAPEPLCLEPVDLCPQRALVVKSHPLVAPVSEGNLLLVVPNQGRVGLVQEVADLVVGQEPWSHRVTNTIPLCSVWHAERESETI